MEKEEEFQEVGTTTPTIFAFMKTLTFWSCQHNNYFDFA